VVRIGAGGFGTCSGPSRLGFGRPVAVKILNAIVETEAEPDTGRAGTPRSGLPTARPVGAKRTEGVLALLVPRPATFAC